LPSEIDHVENLLAGGRLPSLSSRNRRLGLKGTGYPIFYNRFVFGWSTADQQTFHLSIFAILWMQTIAATLFAIYWDNVINIFGLRTTNTTDS
jgi:hypothetical protein